MMIRSVLHVMKLNPTQAVKSLVRSEQEFISTKPDYRFYISKFHFSTLKERKWGIAQ